MNYFVYRNDGPMENIQARSDQARKDFESRYGSIAKVIGFNFEGFNFAVEVDAGNAYQLPDEFEGFTKHAV